MLNAGLLEVMVDDDWKARMWAQVLPKLKVRNDLVLRADAKTGWAIRKGSAKLAAEIDDFFRNWAIKQKAETWVTKADMGTPLVIFCCLAALHDGVHAEVHALLRARANGGASAFN